MTASDSRWMTVAQCAAESSISASEIRRLIARGEIPAIYLGAKLIRVTRQDWEAWLMGWEKTAQPVPVRVIARGRRAQ